MSQENQTSHRPWSRARDFSKSLARVSWAFSMFGLRQVTRWVDVRGAAGDSVAEMDDVSRAIEDGLGTTVGSLYRAGRHVQEGMVDAAFDLAGGSWAGSDSALKQAWRTIDRGWSKVREVAVSGR